MAIVSVSSTKPEQQQPQQPQEEYGKQQESPPIQLSPLTMDDFQRMLGQRDFLIEQLQLALNLAQKNMRLMAEAAAAKK